MAPPLLGRFGAKLQSPQTSPIDSHVKSIFFTKQGSQCILYGFREGSPLHAFVMRNRTYKSVIRLLSRHILSKWLTVQCNNSIRSLKETPFSRRTNEDKLTKQLGFPRPNVSIQPVFYKGGEILHPRIGSKENRGREVANAVCISIYHCHFSKVSLCVSQFASCTNTELFFI